MTWTMIHCPKSIYTTTLYFYCYHIKNLVGTLIYFLSNFHLDSVGIMNIIAIKIELNIYNIIYIINELF
jgi:hypothetical protein